MKIAKAIAIQVALAIPFWIGLVFWLKADATQVLVMTLLAGLMSFLVEAS